VSAGENRDILLSRRTPLPAGFFLAEGGGGIAGFSKKLSFATSPDIAKAIYLYARRIFTAWRSASQEEAPATTALIAESPLFAGGETGKVAFVE